MANVTEQAGFLQSLQRHIRAYSLDWLSIEAPAHDRCGVVLIRPQDRRPLAALGEWIRTLRHATTEVYAADLCGLTINIAVTGEMLDRRPVRVVVEVHLGGADYELLAANNATGVGNAVPVELLLALVDSAAAEGVPAGVTA